MQTAHVASEIAQLKEQLANVLNALKTSKTQQNEEIQHLRRTVATYKQQLEAARQEIAHLRNIAYKTNPQK